MEGGCWEDGIAAYPIFQGSGGGEKLHESRGAAGDRAAAPEPSDPGSGGGAGDDIVPSAHPHKVSLTEEGRAVPAVCESDPGPGEPVGGGCAESGRKACRVRCTLLR